MLSWDALYAPGKGKAQGLTPCIAIPCEARANPSPASGRMPVAGQRRGQNSLSPPAPTGSRSLGLLLEAGVLPCQVMGAIKEKASK